MKRILILCSLYFITLLSYANVCPPATNGNVFYGAYWMVPDNGSKNSVRCDYSNQQIFADREYYESEISRHYQWEKIGNGHGGWYQCHNLIGKAEYCPFG